MILNALTRWSGAAALVLCLSIHSPASDPGPVPLPISAGPVVMAGEVPCATCGTTPAGSCQTCQTCKGHGKRAIPYKVNLCPGACFGYFPTQWHRWEEVCPIPYPGAGLSDAPRIPTPPLPTNPAISTQPKPMVPETKLPTDPMRELPKPMKLPGDPGTLPKIPMPPGY